MERAVEHLMGVPVRGVKIMDAITSHTMCCLHAYFAMGKELDPLKTKRISKKWTENKDS
jgi:hypothetical protein